MFLIGLKTQDTMFSFVGFSWAGKVDFGSVWQSQEMAFKQEQVGLFQPIVSEGKR